MSVKIKNKISATIVTATALVLISTAILLLQVGNAQEQPTGALAIEPSQIFAGVGENFTVAINAVDWTEPGVYSYEFRVKYNTTWLNATSAEIPENHWLKPSLKPSNIFIVDAGTIDRDSGYVSFAATLLGDEPGKTGNGTIAEVTFQAINGPATGNITSLIELTDIILVNPSAQEIPPENYTIGSANVVIPEFSLIYLLVAFIVASISAMLFRKRIT